MKKLRPAPIIGVTPDESLPVGKHALARFELKRAYTDAVIHAGGVPWILPYTADRPTINAYLQQVQGLLITGGAFDVPPELYGEKSRPGLGALKRGRTSFELELLRRALESNTPVLGICGGMQLLNVALGGSLYQDIGREIPGSIAHEQEKDRRWPSHEVAVTAGTLLATLLGPGGVMVNSTHHQAVKRLGRGLVASALAPDGVIEAIELPRHTFCLGVQWHPELLYGSVPINRAIYRAFVNACGV